MTIVTDARSVQPITDTDAVHDNAAHQDDSVNDRAELARLLAQAYVATPLFALPDQSTRLRPGDRRPATGTRACRQPAGRHVANPGCALPARADGRR